MPVDPEKKINEWKDHLEFLWRESVHLAHIDAVFWQVQAILRENPDTNVGISVFPDWMAACYARTLAVGLRSLVDRKKGTISFMKLIEDMTNHRKLVLTRDRYVALYTNLPQDVAHQHFDKIAGEGKAVVPKSVLRRWMEDLESVSEKVAGYCNEHVTHFKKDPANVTLTFMDLRLALRGLQKILEDCHVLLTAGVLMGMEPVIQGDWLAMFRKAWLPPGSKVPSFQQLEDIDLPSSTADNRKGEA